MAEEFKTGGMFDKVCQHCHRPKLSKLVTTPMGPGKLDKVTVVWSLCPVCDELHERGLVP